MTKDAPNLSWPYTTLPRFDAIYLKQQNCDMVIVSQEEECEENYVKKCFIEYSKTAVNVTSKVCRTPLVKVSIWINSSSVEYN